MGYKCVKVSKAIGISVVKVSKGYSMGPELPEVDKFQ
jgi:hypothetical protein